MNQKPFSLNGPRKRKKHLQTKYEAHDFSFFVINSQENIDFQHFPSAHTSIILVSERYYYGLMHFYLKKKLF